MVRVVHFWSDHKNHLKVTRWEQGLRQSQFAKGFLVTLSFLWKEFCALGTWSECFTYCWEFKDNTIISWVYIRRAATVEENASMSSFRGQNGQTGWRTKKDNTIQPLIMTKVCRIASLNTQRSHHFLVTQSPVCVDIPGKCILTIVWSTSATASRNFLPLRQRTRGNQLPPLPKQKSETVAPHPAPLPHLNSCRLHLAWGMRR